jgi:hypothetical protein
MSGKLKLLFVLPVLSLVALTVPATLTGMAVPAEAACPAAIVIGLHGVGEGPSSANSATIAATFKDFQADVTAAGNPSSSYILDPFTYPPVPVSDFNSVAGLKHLANTLDNTVLALATQIIDLKAACPSASIELVGYSLGAWIIQMTLQNTDLWSDVKAVEYYGDPCWYNPSGGYVGLVRFTPNDGASLGCPDRSAYPYEDQPPPFPAQSLCFGGDPICGQGLNPSKSPANIIARFAAAQACTRKNHCTHYDYTGAAAKEGAMFLETEAFGPCTPKINAVGTFQAAATQTVEITGSCFGTGNTSSGADTPYFRISDLTAGWNACWTGDPNTDQVTCDISSWANQKIIFSGFTGVYGQNGWAISAGDQIEIQVWNPQSGEGPSTYEVVAG